MKFDFICKYSPKGSFLHKLDKLKNTKPKSIIKKSEAVDRAEEVFKYHFWGLESYKLNSLLLNLIYYTESDFYRDENPRFSATTVILRYDSCFYLLPIINNFHFLRHKNKDIKYRMIDYQ